MICSVCFFLPRQEQKHEACQIMPSACRYSFVTALVKNSELADKFYKLPVINLIAAVVRFRHTCRDTLSLTARIDGFLHFAGNLGKDGRPISQLRLAEEPHRGIPGGIAAVPQPAPIGRYG